jgi:pyruvate ferredoxin oxidoreductase gamma subunit
VSPLELKSEGRILLNTKRHIADHRVISIDGDAIASEILKLPITNTVMLGAFAAVFGQIPLEQLARAIRQNMPEKLHDKNIAVVEAAWKEAHR